MRSRIHMCSVEGRSRDCRVSFRRTGRKVALARREGQKASEHIEMGIGDSIYGCMEGISRNRAHLLKDEQGARDCVEHTRPSFRRANQCRRSYSELSRAVDHIGKERFTPLASGARSRPPLSFSLLVRPRRCSIQSSSLRGMYRRYDYVTGDLFTPNVKAEG